MKKLLCAILAALILLAPVAVRSASSAELSVGNAKAGAGETADITVTVKNNPGFCYIRVRPEYDAGALELVSAEKGELKTDDISVGKNISVENGKNVKGDGVLLTMRFKVKEGAVSGKYGIKLVFIECYNYDEEEVAFSVTDGFIEISGADAPTAETRTVIVITEETGAVITLTEETDGLVTPAGETDAPRASDTAEETGENGTVSRITKPVREKTETEKNNGAPLIIAVCVAVCAAAAAVIALSVRKKKQ